MWIAIFITYNLLYIYSYRIDKNQGGKVVFIKNEYRLRTSLKLKLKN